MPKPVELLDGAVKHQDTIEISWRFEANFSELPPEGITLDAPGPVPLPGSWKLGLSNDSDDSDDVSVGVRHGDLPIGAFGKSVVVTVQFARLMGAHERRLHRDSWNDGSEPSLDPERDVSYVSYSLDLSRSGLAADGRWPTSEQNSVQKYRYTITFSRDLHLDTAHKHSAPIPT